MSEQPNLAATLEAQLETLGKQLEGTVEEFANSEAEKREELHGQIKALEDAVTKVTETLEEERRSHLPGVETAVNGERDGFSMARACKAIARKDFSDAPYEQEVFDNMKAKAMSQGVGAAGGCVVPEEQITAIIEKLRSRVIAFDLGARDMAVTGVPVTIPRVSTSATAVWVAENAVIAANDLAFEQVIVNPSTAAARVVLSNLLLETSNPAADQIIEEDMAAQLGVAVDSACLIGGGAGEPDGVIATAGVGSVAGVAAGDLIDGIDKLIDFEQELQNADAYGGRLGWAIHPSVLGAIREMETAALPSVQLSRQIISEGFADRILGHEYATSTSLTAIFAGGAASATNSMIFGNWEDLLVMRWGGLRLMSSNVSDDAFQKDQTHIRGTIRMGVALRHVESFAFSA